MFMNKELKVSIFANLQGYASKEVGMDEIVRLIKYDTIVKQKTAVYRQMAHVLSREEANKNVKVKSMEACSVAVVFDGNGKQPENVVRFTGLAMVDLDKLGDKLPTVYQKVIADPHTEDCYTTISGEGLHIFYRYTRQDTDSPLNATSWRAAFVTGNEYYKQLTGCDYDTGCSNYGRLSGLAHDPEVYYNPDAEPFVITDEMIVKANFADNTHEGRPYKEHTAGTQQSTPEEAWQRVQHLLSKRNMTYEPHHRHDYILHACYLFNRFGVPEDELRTWSENQWNDFDSRERNSIITHCYKQEDEHGTWCLHSDRRNKRSHENAMITLAEIRQWLSEHTEVIYNVVTDQTMIRHTLINSELSTNHYQLLDDRILVTLRAQMSIDTDKRVLKSDVYDVIKSDFALLVHPVRDYLNSLPPWDGNDRIAELTSHLHAEAVVPDQSNEEAQQALCWAFHKWHCAAVGTWLDDSVTNHEVFVLIGKQGIYKTTCFRFLLPPELRSYFWENAHNAFSSKDDHLALSENCLTVIEEVEATGSHELSELKSLITSDTIKERRPYARFREAKHRLASFCATGNQQHFLTDDTGNRRWLCFKVSHIDNPRTWKINYQQLYAQLLHEFQHGFRYWFDSADEQQVERLNQPFRVESDEEQLIQTRLRVPQEGEPTKLMNAATICQLLNGGRVGYPLSSRKISMAMKRLGFQQVHSMNGNYFRVYEIPYDQVQRHLSAGVNEGMKLL